MSSGKATRQSFGEHLVTLGEKYPEIVVLDADLSKSTKSELFAKKFPTRFYEMGIAEANMIGTGAGLALSGKRPFICSFGCFVTGRFDQIRMSIGYAEAPVTVVGTHSGVGIGEDGHSQMALEDVALMRTIPNFKVVQPADDLETRSALDAIMEQSDPVYLRLTRQELVPVTPAGTKFRFGEPTLLQKGTDIALLTTGALTQEGVAACQSLAKKKISVTHLNIASLKPLRADALLDYLPVGVPVVTVEDHYIDGGLGGIIAEILSENRPTRLYRIGVQGRFGQSGTPADNYREYGLTSGHIANRLETILQVS